MNGKKMEITLSCNQQYIPYAVTRDCVNTLMRAGDVEEVYEMGRIKENVIIYIKTSLSSESIRLALNSFKERRKVNYFLSVKS